MGSHILKTKKRERLIQISERRQTTLPAIRRFSADKELVGRENGRKCKLELFIYKSLRFCIFANHLNFRRDDSASLPTGILHSVSFLPPPPSMANALNYGIINIIKLLIKIERVGHCVKRLILCIFFPPD